MTADEIAYNILSGRTCENCRRGCYNASEARTCEYFNNGFRKYETLLLRIYDANRKPERPVDSTPV